MLIPYMIMICTFFSHSMCCLFTLLLVSFAPKVLILVKFNLFFLFFCLFFSVVFKKSLPNPVPAMMLFPCVSSKSFIVLGLFFFFFYKFILFYLFLAALGLCCFAQAFSSCGEWGLLFFAVCGLLIAMASLVAEHGL